MIVTVCVDDNNGMLFNQRRQSQDRLLRARLLARLNGQPLWMNSYSQGLFGATEGLRVAEDFLALAGPGEYCWLENLPLLPWEDKVEQIILYKWNRVYPADLYFDIPLAAPGWLPRESTDFVGSSHEKITEEVYTR